MDELGLNNANEFEFDGIIYFSLCMVDGSGNMLPIGLPIIYKEQDERYIRLTEEQVIELLKQLPGDD